MSDALLKTTAVGADRIGLSRTLAGLDFAKRLVHGCGRVSAREVAIVRRAGFSNREIAKILAKVTSNLPDG